MRHAYAYGIRAILTTVALLVGYGIWMGGSSDAVPPDFSPEDVGYTAASHDPSLSLATWNLRWLDTPGRGEVKRTNDDYNVLSEYARALDADIVALQEAAGQRALERVFNPRVYTFEISRRIGDQRVGFAIKRGLEVTRHDDIVDLSRGGEYRYGVDIGVTYHGESLRLLAVHLASGCQRTEIPATDEQPSDSDDICAVLSSQSHDLATWIRAREQQGQDWLILGDFNRQPSLKDPFWSKMTQADPLVVPTEGRSPRCRDGRYPNHIDHFVFDRDITRWSRLSDIREITYSPSHQRSYANALPDHCPLSISIQPPRASTEPERPDTGE
jgi:endonuclease/exonuclease/phosphatase family metal-dependent hydrolase